MGIGSDPMIGTTTEDVLQALHADEWTEAVIIAGRLETAGVTVADTPHAIVEALAGG